MTMNSSYLPPMMGSSNNELDDIFLNLDEPDSWGNTNQGVQKRNTKQATSFTPLFNEDSII